MSSSPSEIELLRQQIELLTKLLKEKDRDIERLQHRLDLLLRRRFGRSSEKLHDGQGQLFAPEEDESEETGEDEAPASEDDPTPDDDTPTKKSRHKGRQKLSPDLPRKRNEIHPDPQDCICEHCNEAMSPIGEEVSERLDYEPASYFVIETARIKYGCPGCQIGVVCAELPPEPIEKGMPAAGLLAHVVTSKYCDHLPLYRLESIFARAGIHLSRKTLCSWVAAVAILLVPIVARLREIILSRDVIQSDDTTIRVLDPEATGGSRRGYFWGFAGKTGEVVFHYNPSRSGQVPAEWLGITGGYLQVDGYAGYKDLFRARRPVIEVGCWAHARRKFRESLTTAPKHASEIVTRIRALYRIEKSLKGADDETRFRVRQERSRPILRALRKRLRELKDEVLPKSPLGMAISYTLDRWRALRRYACDGRLEIDNNRIERAIRPIAIGRKNYLFAGSDAGAESGATIYSLVVSCKELGIDPFAYFRDVLAAVSTHPASRIDELTPAGWKAAREQRLLEATATS